MQNNSQIKNKSYSKTKNVIDSILLWMFIFAIFIIFPWAISLPLYAITSTKPGAEGMLAVIYYLYLTPILIISIPFFIIRGLKSKKRLRSLGKYHAFIYIGPIITLSLLAVFIIKPSVEFVIGRNRISKAHDQLDVSLCDQAKHGIMKNEAERCRSNIAILLKNPDLCPKGIGSFNANNSCVKKVAFYAQMPSACKFMSEASDREKNNCLALHSFNTRGFCNNLKKYKLEEKCLDGWEDKY